MRDGISPTRVGHWMSTDLVTTRPETALGDAMDLMNERRIRHLPVMEGSRLVGLLSNRDAVRCLLAPPDPDEDEDDEDDREDGEGDREQAAPRHPLTGTRVSDVMTGGHLHLATPQTLVREAAELMCREKINALPVVQGERLVGIVTSEDLLWAFLESTAE